MTLLSCEECLVLLVLAPGTFSSIGISAGLGSVSPGTNYNVGVDINRADFKEDYAASPSPSSSWCSTSSGDILGLSIAIIRSFFMFLY